MKLYSWDNAGHGSVYFNCDGPACDSIKEIDEHSLEIWLHFGEWMDDELTNYDFCSQSCLGDYRIVHEHNLPNCLD